MKRLLVNDCLTALPGTRTFWHDLQDQFLMEFVGGDYATLLNSADAKALPGVFTDAPIVLSEPNMASLIIRNASYFGPLTSSQQVPTISLLQDIFTEGPQRKMQEAVIASSRAVVFNSAFTSSHYPGEIPGMRIIPLPVDFTIFEPGNPMGLQQSFSLPDGAVCWVGASQGAAGQVKGYDIFLQMVRANPDIPFVAVFKDAIPDSMPPNLRAYARLHHRELAQVIGACRVGLCTSRTESQHLAGIEMGACGLPLVAPEVGTYWKRREMPGALITEPNVQNYSQAIRLFLQQPPKFVMPVCDYWQKEFNKGEILRQWTELVEQVEGAG